MIPEAKALGRRRRIGYEPTPFRHRDAAAGDRIVPWVVDNRAGIGPVNWTQFTDHAAICHYRHLCQICGVHIPRGRRVHLMVERGTPFTSGPAVHPLCALVALKQCPHLVNHAPIHEPIAWLWPGIGQGYGHNGATVSDLLALEADTGPRPGSLMLTFHQLRALTQNS